MKLKTYHDEIYVNYYSMLAPSTVAGYESAWKLHVEPMFGGWEIEEIRVRNINMWLTTFEKPGSGRKAFKILKQIINSAIADECYRDDIAEPKFRAVRQPKMPYKEKPRPLTFAEINTLLRTVYGWEYEPTVICGVWLGIRRSEQCGLQWGDINLRNGFVKIRRGLQVIERTLQVTEVKTKKSIRNHYLPPEAIARLREIKREKRPKQTDFLVDNINPEEYARKLKAFAKKQGIYCPSPKYFRHSFSTNLHDMGVDDFDIQNLLGHESFSTSANSYMVLRETRMKRIMLQYQKEVMKAGS